MSALFRIRKSWFGDKSILQKFDGDIGSRTHPPAFRDVLYDEKFGPFTLVRQDEYKKLIERVQLADKRAAQQRKARKDKKDFEASRFREQ